MTTAWRPSGSSVALEQDAAVFAPSDQHVVRPFDFDAASPGGVGGPSSPTDTASMAQDGAARRAQRQRTRGSRHRCRIDQQQRSIEIARLRTTQARPRRPRPPSAGRAVSQSLPGSPALARSRHSALVEPIVIQVQSCRKPSRSASGQSAQRHLSEECLGSGFGGRAQSARRSAHSRARTGPRGRRPASVRRRPGRTRRAGSSNHIILTMRR